MECICRFAENITVRKRKSSNNLQNYFPVKRRKRENRVPRQILNEESEVRIVEMPLDPLSEARLESLKEKQKLEKKTLEFESNQEISKIENQLDKMKQLKRTNEEILKKKHDAELVTLKNNLKKNKRKHELEDDSFLKLYTSVQKKLNKQTIYKRYMFSQEDRI